MRILPQRSIENNVYSVKIKPLEWGTPILTAEEELEMLKDIPQTLRYADIDFTENFKIVNGLPVVSSDEGSVTVTLDLRGREFPLDENFELSLSVGAGKIPDLEIDDKVLTNKHLVAQAKIITYETKIINQITKLLTNAAAHVNGFIDGTKIINIFNISTDDKDNKEDETTVIGISEELIEKLKNIPQITQEDIERWNNKVDKVEGKQLSTEDFTTEFKNKLEGIIGVHYDTVSPDSMENGEILIEVIEESD